MTGIYFLCIYALGLITMALIVLAVVPSFRITISNVLVFALGAVLGNIAIISPWQHMRTNPKSVMSKIPEASAFCLALIGALPGGVILAWRKARLRRTVRRSESSLD